MSVDLKFNNYNLTNIYKSRIETQIWVYLVQINLVSIKLAFVALYLFHI
jgi:hypothetical protein